MKHRRYSIATAMVTAFTILIMAVTLVINARSYENNRRQLQSVATDYTNQLISQVNSQMDMYVDYLKDLSNFIVRNSAVTAYLRDSSQQEAVASILSHAATTRDEIFAIALAAADGRVLFDDPSYRLNPYATYQNAGWFQTAVEQPDQVHISTSRVENLVEGQANQMAFASALQVASSTHSVYNPLFIYGGVGLGKTHLMHAIGNRFLRNNPKAKVLCVSAQQYTQEFVDAMRLKNVNSERYTEAMRKFDARYRGIDMLLIDDIQSFRDREGTQTNFFLTFESMVPHGKQIVLTSDTYPKNLSEFQDRLLSRLTQGLIVMIEPPEFEMRVQILLQKAERSGINMPQDVAEIIAKRIKSNVRELEGAVQQILAYTRFHQVPVTLDTAKMALRDIFKATATPVTIDNIQKAVAEYYGIKPSDIVAKSRKANLVRARQVAMYLSKELTNKSLPEIGALFGGRDHTTVIYAHRKVMSERNTDDGLKHDIHLLEQRLKN